VKIFQARARRERGMLSKREYTKLQNEEKTLLQKTKEGISRFRKGVGLKD